MIILHQDPCVSARELCDKDLRKTLKQAGDLAFKALENRSDESDLTLRWVCRSPANLKWTIEYAQFCAAESYYRFGRKRARVSYRVLQLPDISAGSVKELPSNPDKGRDYYRKEVAPKSVWPNLLWSKRYPPDWLSRIIFPNAIH
jgi:hypothetical protein